MKNILLYYILIITMFIKQYIKKLCLEMNRAIESSIQEPEETASIFSRH